MLLQKTDEFVWWAIYGQILGLYILRLHVKNVEHIRLDLVN